MSGALPSSRLKRFLRVAVVLATVAFVLSVVLDLARRFDPQSVHLRPGYLLLAFAPAGLAMWTQFEAWRALVRRFSGIAMPVAPAFALYLDSQMARYTPGKVGLLAVRVAGAARVGVPGRVLGSTLLIEIASWTAVGLAVGAGGLLLGAHVGVSVPIAPLGLQLSGLLHAGSWLLASGAVGGVTLLCTLPRHFLPVWLRKLLLGELAQDGTSDAPLAPGVLPLWHAVHWGAWMATGALLALSVGASVLQGLVFGSALPIGIVLGFLAVVTPAGAGVREAVITAITSPLLGPAVALSFSLLARGVSLGAEVSLWALGRHRARRASGASGEAPK